MQLLVILFFIAASVVHGQVLPCGCHYLTKSGPTLSPEKLMVMDGSDKTCAISCEKGYVLEFRADYLECRNGVNWKGQDRVAYGTRTVVDDPLLTCVSASPTSCAANAYNTFPCKYCDDSKIFATPASKGDCTIMCDRGYRLVAKGAGEEILPLAEASLKGASWKMYAFGSIETATSAAAGSVSFTCEDLNKPKPPTCGCEYDFLEGGDEFDSSQLTASNTNPGSCSVACKEGYSVVTDAISGVFPSATCAQYKWTATGKGELSAAKPKLSCTKTPQQSDSCKKCARDLINVTTSGGGAKPFAADTIDTSGPCAVRTFVCEGPEPNIEINGKDLGTISDDKRVTLSLNCNAGGTAWTACGQPVTQMECASTL